MAAAVTYLTSAGDGATATAYTFSSQSLGTATSDRHIVVQAANSSTGAGGFASVTVGGVSATEVIEKLHSQNTADGTALWIAAVPTGTTGDVVVTCNALSARCGIALWGLTGINSATAYDTGSGQGNLGTNPSASDTLAVEAGGMIIGASYTSNAGTTDPPTFVWTGVTEEYETVAESKAVVSGGSDDSGTVEAGKTIQVDVTSNSNRVSLVTASWSPSAGGGATFIPRIMMS